MLALCVWRWHDRGHCIGQLPLVSILRGCDANTTVSYVASLYLIPGAPAPLARIYVGGNNLLLLYADNRARLWDVKTLEFWRSMDIEKAKDLIAQDGWTELSVTLCCVVCRINSYSVSRSLRDSPPMGNVPTALSVSLPDSCMFYNTYTGVCRES